MKTKSRNATYARSTFMAERRRGDHFARELEQRAIEIQKLRNDLRAVAMLACKTPLFDSPITIYAAERIRDRVLYEFGLLPNTDETPP